MLRNLLLTAVYLLLISCGFAQSINPQPEIIYYGDQKGFKSSGQPILDIQTDSNKNIWIVQSKSILKYNGSEFKRIKTDKISQRYLVKLHFSNGRRFVTDVRGQIFFIEADTIRPYEWNDSLFSLNKNKRQPSLYFDEEDRLHIVYAPNYFVIDQGKVSMPLGDRALSLKGILCVLRKGELPFVFRGPGKTNINYYLLNNELELIDSIPLKKLKLYGGLNYVVQKKDGNFLLSSEYGNLFEFNENGFIREIEYEDDISGMFLDKDNGLWLNLLSNGINYHENAKPQVKSVLKVKDKEVGTNRVKAQDFEGGLWNSSISKGLNQIPYPYFRYYSRDNGLIERNQIGALKLIGDSILYTVLKGKISIYNSKTGEKDSIMTPLPNRYMLTLYYDAYRKRLWAGARAELWYYEKNRWHSVPLSKNGKEIKSRSHIVMLPFNPIEKEYSILGFVKSTYFLCRDTTIDIVSKPFKGRIFNVLKRKDSILVNCEDGLYLDVGEERTYIGEKYPQFSSRLVDLSFFDNKLWLSTAKDGLFILTPDSLIKVKYKGNMLTHGSLVKRNQNELWVLAKQGSFEFSRLGKANHSLSYKVSAYARRVAAISRDRVNNELGVYWGTKRKGILTVRFEDLKKDSLIVPAPVFTSLKINDRQRKVHDSVYQLAYDEGFIQLSYVAHSFKKGEILYKYRMQGLKKTWTETDKRFIQFTTLPPGEYTFEIKSKRGNEFWSEPQQLRFSIAAPIWQRWWFITIMILLLIFIIYGIVAYRFNRIKKDQQLLVEKLRAEQKALRAQMDPHFVFNIVSSVQYLIEENLDKASEFLDMFANSMRKILNHSNENYVRLGNEVDFLKEYIEMEKFKLANHFNFEIEADNIQEHLDKFIPPFLIQPLVENAILHGLKNQEKKGLLQLQFTVHNKILKVKIRDNGIGRLNAEELNSVKYQSNRKSHALRIIKERLELHNGKKENVLIRDLKDENGKDSGTMAEIHIRLIDKLENE